MTGTCVHEYVWLNLLNRVGNPSGLASCRVLFLWPKMPIHVVSYMLVASTPLDDRLAMQWQTCLSVGVFRMSNQMEIWSGCMTGLGSWMVQKPKSALALLVRRVTTTISPDLWAHCLLVGWLGLDPFLRNLKRESVLPGCHVEAQTWSSRDLPGASTFQVNHSFIHTLIHICWGPTMCQASCEALGWWE